MAEATLVKEFLTEDMKKAGAELTRKLDEAQWPVVASFWYFVSTENEWKLILASPKLDSDGPMRAYDIISKAVSTLSDFAGIGLISAVAPHHPAVRALASVIDANSDVEGLRISKRMVNGQYVDDAYVYRVVPAAVA